MDIHHNARLSGLVESRSAFSRTFPARSSAGLIEEFRGLSPQLDQMLFLIQEPD
jgi:hypothetical protein